MKKLFKKNLDHFCEKPFERIIRFASNRSGCIGKLLDRLNSERGYRRVGSAARSIREARIQQRIETVPRESLGSLTRYVITSVLGQEMAVQHDFHENIIVSTDVSHDEVWKSSQSAE